jgi:hypothetical protein
LKNEILAAAERITDTWSSKMLTSKYRSLMAFCGLCLVATGFADELMIFPNADQTPEQQEQDKYACYSWGKEQSGFDPMAPPTATEPPPEQEARKGGLLRGAARGAVIGGVVDNEAGKGAAAGAFIGGMRRQDQKRKEAAEREQWEQEQQRIYAAKRDRYNRAYGACLEGKDYTVR